MKLTKTIVIAACTVLYLTPATYAGPGNGNGNFQGHGVGNGNGNHTGQVHAPELDAGMASGAFALLGTALLLLHERRRRQ